MHRRNFLKGLSLASITAGVFPIESILSNTIKTLKIIKPERLNIGDTLGLIAPGSFITEDELKESINNIESLGFKTAYTENILARD